MGIQVVYGCVQLRVIIRIAVVFRPLDDDIGCDAFAVNPVAIGCQPTGNGQAYTAAVDERLPCLNRSLAKGGYADNSGATAILQCAGNQFGSTGAVVIYQNDH